MCTPRSIGLPGRIGEYPDQGSHPGPLSFYLLAPTYRLLGSTSWALEVATVTIHVAAIVTAVWIGQRRAGWRGVLGVAALVALVIRGVRPTAAHATVEPVPSADRLDRRAAGDLVGVVRRRPDAHPSRRRRIAVCPDPRALPRSLCRVDDRFARRRLVAAPSGRRPCRRRGSTRGGVVDAAVHRPTGHERGNIRTLLDHFGDPSEPVLGLVDGTRLALRHLDVWAGFAGFTGDLEGAGRFVSPADPWRGALTLGVWLVAAGIARRHGPAILRRLHVVIAAVLLLGLASMTRIFGLPWYYLTLWAWGTTTLAVGAVVWTALSWWRTSSRTPLGRQALPLLSLGVLGATTIASTLTFASADVPEERLSVAVEALAGPTYDAIAEGDGAANGVEGAYQVRWSDAADIGSPGFGLLNELERRGLDVAADEFFHVPVTDHRVRPRERADAQVHLATGGYVDRWRLVPGAVEVAAYDPRSAAEVARAGDVRDRLLARLQVEGLDDVGALVDTNLFGASLDPRISDDDLVDITELLDLGQPMVVFIARPDVEPPA